jgi:hypothetical protein
MSPEPSLVRFRTSRSRAEWQLLAESGMAGILAPTAPNRHSPNPFGLAERALHAYERKIGKRLIAHSPVLIKKSGPPKLATVQRPLSSHLPPSIPRPAITRVGIQPLSLLRRPEWPRRASRLAVLVA